MTPYVVRSGDHLDLIAHRHGLRAQDIWDHPKNADLKKRRGNPNILCCGDVLYLPETQTPWAPVSVGGNHRFQAAVPGTRLSVTFAVGGRPLAAKKCVVRGMPPPNEFTTDGSGKLEVTLPLTVQTVVVDFPDVPMARRIRVGHLDPVDEPSGVMQRLQNLGYASSRSAVDLSNPASLAPLLRRFQQDSGLEPTGTLDSDTRDALEKAHGC